MRKILKIHGKGILHMLDLKREFDPWEIYKQLDVFCSFARIHSLPLSLMLGDERAAFLDKKFWYYILNGQYDEGDTAEDKKEYDAIISCSGDAETCLKLFFKDYLMRRSTIKKSDDAKAYLELYFKECFNRQSPLTNEEIEAGNKSLGCMTQNNLKQLDEDIQMGWYAEKISHISKAIDEKDSQEQVRKAVALLAICELAEVDARSHSFRTAKQTGIEDFTAEKALTLKTGDLPYQYWHYEDKTLKEEEQIRTVKLTASGTGKAVIELHSAGKNQCVERVELKAGESRWLNAVGNRVVKFLPNISMCGDQTITQVTRGQEKLQIRGAKNDEWTLNISDVSSFSTSGEHDGFLLIRNGEIVSLYYHRCSDAVSQMRLEMIPGPIVEVMLTGDGYLILRNNGQIASDFLKTDQKFVSLDDATAIL